MANSGIIGIGASVRRSNRIRYGVAALGRRGKVPVKDPGGRSERVWTQRRRVLVVDDEPMVRDVLSRYLEQQRVRGRGGERRRARAGRVRRAPSGSRSARSDAAAPRRVRGLPPDPGAGRQPGDHDHRPRAGPPTASSGSRSVPTITSASPSRPARSSPGFARSCVARLGRIDRSDGAGMLAFDGIDDRPAARARSESTGEACRADAEGVRPAAPFRVQSRASSSPGCSCSDELWDVAFEGDPPRSPSTSAGCARRSRPTRPSPRRLVTVWGAATGSSRERG